MIAIDNKLISDELITEQFICDIAKCKGACCVDGDAGAPLDQEEKKEIDNLLTTVWPLLSENSKKEIKTNGKYIYTKAFGWVTPVLDNGACVYGDYDKAGVFLCHFEQIYREEKSDWKKPISCHLFPIRIKKNKKMDMEFVNYEFRESTCNAACALGKKEKVLVYEFLKEPIIRKYGKEFYDTLDATSKHVNNKES